MKNPYDDIIKLFPPKSNKHPQMPRYKRAAQFAPFAALSGHDSAVNEVARRTDKKIQLDQYIKEDLNRRLSIIEEHIGDREELSFLHFQEDKLKEGGRYIRSTGPVKKIDKYEGLVVMEDGEKINIEDIIEIKGELFRSMEI